MDYTSIQERIRASMRDGEGGLEAGESPACAFPSESVPPVSDASGTERENGKFEVPAAQLVKFTGSTEEPESSVPFHFSDYLELVDWTGRAIRKDKRGYIPADVPPILVRPGLETESWIETIRHFRRHFYDYVGPGDILAQHGRMLERRWLRGVGACRKLLSGAEQTAGSMVVASG